MHRDSDETITFRCRCGRELHVSAKAAGQVFCCPSCGQESIVPRPEEAAAAGEGAVLEARPVAPPAEPDEAPPTPAEERDRAAETEEALQALSEASRASAPPKAQAPAPAPAAPARPRAKPAPPEHRRPAPRPAPAAAPVRPVAYVPPRAPAARAPRRRVWPYCLASMGLAVFWAGLLLPWDPKHRLWGLTGAGVWLWVPSAVWTAAGVALLAAVRNTRVKGAVIFLVSLVFLIAVGAIVIDDLAGRPEALDDALFRALRRVAPAEIPLLGAILAVAGVVAVIWAGLWILITPGGARALPAGVAAGRPAAPALAAGAKQNAAEIVAGIAMFLTLLLPWSAAGGKVTTSWSMLVEFPPTVIAFIVLAWLIGVAAVVVSFLLKRLPLWLAHLGLGVLGLIMLLAAIRGMIPVFARGNPLLGRGSVIVGMICGVALLATLIAVHLRLRVRPALPVRIAEGAPAAGLLLLSAAALIGRIINFAAARPAVREKLVLDLLFMILLTVMVLAACALAGIHAAAKTDRRELAKTAMVLLYVHVAAAAAYVIFRAELVFKRPGSTWTAVSAVLLAGPIVLFLCRGGVRVASHLVGQLQERAEVLRRMSPADRILAKRRAEARLRTAAKLRKKGLISQEEYAAVRERILGEI